MSPDENKKKAEEASAAEKESAAQPAEAQDGEVKDHDLSPLADTAASGEAGNIDLLMDISIPVIARLGATEMRIRDILQLLPG
jgi:flagellar motor switch/type III secretory pathway protein FliN